MLFCISLQTVFAQDERDFLAEFNKPDKKLNAKKNQWAGKWTYPSRFYGAELNIKILSPNKFKFTITAFNGANSGEISGAAVVKGNKAYFDDRIGAKKTSEANGCRLLFTNKGKIVDLEQSTECNSYGGLGVTFGRGYVKGKTSLIETNFVTNEVFQNDALDGKFKVLVGKEYKRFLDSFQTPVEDKDSDGLNAKVFSACVRGMCPWNAAIIMYDGRENIWAAVVNVDDEKMTYVYYFTNNSAWKDKLPKTFESWIQDKRESNENLTVVYKNKK